MKTSFENLVVGAIAVELFDIKNWFVGKKGAKDLLETGPKNFKKELTVRQYRQWIKELEKKGWDFDSVVSSARDLRMAHRKALCALI